MATTVKPETIAGSTNVTTQRLVSLDLFRGATIAAMILVNNAGDEPNSYWPLRHAHWNGWTPTDLIFPFFLFIVGVAMPFSFSSRMKRGATKSELLRHALVRGVVLFGIGLFLNGFPNEYHWHSWRVYGVLQRIGICYIITAALALWSNRRGWITAAITCLAGYWIIMRFVPVPGFGVPTHAMPILDPDRNIVAWLDRKLLMGHLYDKTRDPEGIISTIPAVGTCLLGLLTGDWLRSARSAENKAIGMASFGVAGVIAGEIVNIWLPINKNVWTSSFVLLTAGIALLCLSVCYWAVDIKSRRGAVSKFFLIFGMNAIAAYVFAEIISHSLDRLSAGGGMNWQEYIYQHTFTRLANPANASLLYALAYVLMCWVAMFVLYRKKIFLKI